MDLRAWTSSAVMYSSGLVRSMRPEAVTCVTSLRGMPTTTCMMWIMSSSSASLMASFRRSEAFMGLVIMLALMPSEGVSR